MKKIVFSIIYILASIVSVAQNYYYSGGKQIPLTIDSTTLFVQLREQSNAEQVRTYFETQIPNQLIINDLQVGGGKCLIVKYSNDISFSSLHSLRTNLASSVKYITFSQYLQNSPFYLTDKIVLQLKSNASITQVLQPFGSFIGEIKSQAFNKYLVEITQIDKMFEIANQIYTSGFAEYAHPDFQMEIVGANPLFPNQYYLNNTGQNGGTPNIDINAPEAWALVQNCSINARIRVAVIDDGVEEHEDLNNLLPIGFTPRVSNGNGRPIRTSASHGQACAGIIGADNNQIGIRGVATNVEILPINIFAIWSTSNDIANSIDWAWNEGKADILSNSWNYSSTDLVSDEIIFAIQRARTLGREGKGCAVIFSSGNSNQFYVGINFPANIPNVIAVGAVNNQGDLWAYSSRGAEMSLVASSGNIGSGDVVTIDRMGISGYEVGNYTTRFGGTSAACPQVAGVAALMLQANPNLTEEQVKQILQETARDLGPSGFDSNFGFGLVDAEAAVRRVLLPLIQNGVTGSNLAVACGNTTYRLSPSSGQVTLPLTWQVSANLQIVSGQGTSELVVAPINATTSDWGFVRAIFNNTCTGQQEIYKSVWVGRPRITGGLIGTQGQTGTIETTLYFQNPCPFEMPPRPIYDKVCVSANGASGSAMYEIEDIIGNASQSFAYSGSQTCFGFLEEGYYEFRIRAKNEQCTPTAYSDWLLFKITALQNEPYCEPPPIEPPDVCYDEWGQAYLCPSGLRYFPNTSSGELNVEYNANYVKLELHNKYGQKVCEADLERHKNKKINLQNLPNDVYFLHLIDRSGARVQRQVILQK